MIYIRKLLLTLLIVALFVPGNCLARSLDNDEVFAFANFIYDLVKTSQIPKSGAFCILGNDEVAKLLFDRDKNIVDLDHHPKKHESCKAIYISQGKEKILRSELARFGKSKVLTIAIFEDFTEIGGMVRVDMGRRNFELTVNSKAMKEAGIKLNSLATSLIIN